MSLNKKSKNFRIHMLILVIEALLPFMLLYALNDNYIWLGRITSIILALGIVYLAVFQ